MITIIYVLLLVLSIIVLVRNKVTFLSLLPLFLLLFDTGFTYFSSNSIITYSKLIIICVFILLKWRKIFTNLKFNKPIIVFILYCLILIPFSTEQSATLRNSFKVLVPMLYFYLGIVYLSNKRGFELLLRFSIYMIIIAVFFGSLGYVFGIGREFSYGDDISMGTVGLLQGGNYYTVAVAITIVAVIFLNNYLNLSNFQKYLVIISTVVAYILMVLTMRRTSIILPMVGLITLIVFNRKAFSKIFVGLVLFISILIALWPLYGDLLTRRYVVREEMGRFEKDFYKTEGRFLETQTVVNKTFSFEDVNHSLFGSNVFAGGWKGGTVRRMYHTDHAQILGTTGIIGLILYIGIYLWFIKYYLKFRKHTYFSDKLVNLNSLLLAIIIMSLVTGLNGSIFIVTFRTTVFLFIGALIGRINNEINSLRVSTNYSL